MTNAGGRPRKIENPGQMDELVEAYWAQCVTDERPVTLTGLVRHLGLSSRQSLDEYAQYEGFSDPVKRAKLLVEMAYEERLHDNSPTGAIFALKNMGWSDKQEHDHSSTDGTMRPTVIEVVSPDDESED